jgi:hypothetical protein
MAEPARSHVDQDYRMVTTLAGLEAYLRAHAVDGS